MKALILDTSSDTLTVMVINQDKIYTALRCDSAKKHNLLLMPTIEMLLSDANLLPTDIGTLGVVVGPGSFTGIRLGVATINAMARVSGANVIEITSLSIIAEEYRDTEVLALIDAKNNNFYGLHIFNNTSEYFDLTLDKVNTYTCKKVFRNDSYNSSLIKVFNRLAMRRIYNNRACPFYIKKSSAEYGI